MILKPTALIYSSHNRGDYLHREWIVNRALESSDNKTILFLPFSMDTINDQDYAYGGFTWFFKQFEPYGLHHETFFYHPNISKEDVDTLLYKIMTYEVVILGGGRTSTGFERLNHLGVISNGDYKTFKNILHLRQQSGKLTVGFSAGAAQLCDANNESHHEPYSLMHLTVATLHHESSRNEELKGIAQKYPNCLTFGLPNDSAVASNVGNLPSGNKYQLLQFITDNSWDHADDFYHIKTRQGAGIEHFYNDGRYWKFFGGDIIIRVFSPDFKYQDAWIIQANSHIVVDYWKQQQSFFHNLDHIINTF